MKRFNWLTWTLQAALFAARLHIGVALAPFQLLKSANSMERDRFCPLHWKYL
jgi:hypothetical protein